MGQALHKIKDKAINGREVYFALYQSLANPVTGENLLDMTATPKRDDNIDTYNYLGDPIYTYNLRQGIDNGFLAPYRVYRVISDVDASGLQIDTGVLDRCGSYSPLRGRSCARFLGGRCYRPCWIGRLRVSCDDVHLEYQRSKLWHFLLKNL